MFGLVRKKTVEGYKRKARLFQLEAELNQTLLSRLDGLGALSPISWKTDTGLEGIVGFTNAEMITLNNKVNAAVRLRETKTKTVPITYSMTILLKEIH